MTKTTQEALERVNQILHEAGWDQAARAGESRPHRSSVKRSEWPSQSPQLQIELTVPPDADAEILAGGLLQLLDLIGEHDRKLGGAGLRKVAEQAQPGSVVLTLVAVQPDGAGDRMDKICDMLNGANAILELLKEVKHINACRAA